MTFNSFLPVAEIIDTQGWLLSEDEEDVAEKAADFALHLKLGKLNALTGQDLIGEEAEDTLLIELRKARRQAYISAGGKPQITMAMVVQGFTLKRQTSFGVGSSLVQVS